MTGDARRVPALDGLRGVAVTLVVLSHAAVPGFRFAGTVGVTVFFVLSGYLITGLLLAERDRRGRIDLRGFWVRRAARLLPALLLVLAVVAVTGIADRRSIAATLLYAANWWGIQGHAMNTLGHMWSLAVEEQFYLLAPLLVILLPRRALLPVFLAGAAGSVALRFLLWDDGAGLNRVYAGTDTRADALLIGCALAVAPAVRVSRTIASAAGMGLLALGAMPEARIEGVILLGLGLAAVLSAMLVAARPVWLAHPALVWMGTVSYGIYLWHLPLLRSGWLPSGPWQLPALVAATVGCAAVSFYLLERPVQRWARGLSPSSAARSAAASPQMTR